jgi:hypothetical protein
VRASGSNRVSQVVLDVAPRHSQLPGKGRHGARLGGKQIDQMPSASHPTIIDASRATAA